MHIFCARARRTAAAAVFLLGAAAAAAGEGERPGDLAPPPARTAAAVPAPARLAITPEIAIVGPTELPAGTPAFLTVEGLPASSAPIQIRWELCPAPAGASQFVAFRTVDRGPVAFFWSAQPGPVCVLLAVVVDGKLELVRHDMQIGGGEPNPTPPNPNPVPPGPTPPEPTPPDPQQAWVGLARDTAVEMVPASSTRGDEAEAFSTALATVVSAARAGKYQTAAEARAAVRMQTGAALGPAYDRWAPFGQKMGQYIGETIRQSGEADFSIARYCEIWSAIAAGLKEVP